MKRKEITALLDEPACTHNHKAKPGCVRLKPGATAGVCAFDGAQIALLPIGDVAHLAHLAHLAHGSIACTGNSWDNRSARSSGPNLYRIGMTTDLTEAPIAREEVATDTCQSIEEGKAYIRTLIGDQGTHDILFELANLLLGLEHDEIHPYRSRLKQRPEHERTTA
ncbi:hypothetical protein MARPU_12385 [Marichromatium purpuratum 984]|uniref:Uncharacterized protein n=1 Tax=Marichromatium purpuratum 984 TaxID=765910 RepID=W0E941_MARPU|nr:hypothetical protein MARPU_12385 [Marichromatium purpuratum 984]